MMKLPPLQVGTTGFDHGGAYTQLDVCVTSQSLLSFISSKKEKVGALKDNIQSVTWQSEARDRKASPGSCVS